MQTATTKIPKSAMTEYVLHEQPEHILYRIGEQVFKSLLNGQTFVLSASGFWLPTPGCPAPEKLPLANFLAFLNRNAKWIPAAILVAILFVVTQFALLVTNGGEFAAVWMRSFSTVMNGTLIVLGLLALVAYAISQFRKGIKIELDFGLTKELPSVTTMGISIAPDIAVFSESETETPIEYNARVKEAIERDSGWVLVLPFRSEYGAIHTGGDADKSEGHVFIRSNPPHDGGDIIDFESAKSARSIYGRERWQDYAAYCQEFAKRYTVWAPTAKIHDGENPLNVILQRAAMFAFAMLLSFAGAAQKSAQVRAYLGEVRYTQDAPTGEVDFVFRNRVYTRIAGGSKTYDQLLQSAPGYTDADDSGKLVGITIDGKAVLPAKPSGNKSETDQASSALEIPEDVPTMPRTKGFFESLPDSSELAVMKRQNIMARREQWTKVEPALEYTLWLFWQFMILIVGIGGVLWILSRASATDAIHDLSGYPLIGNAITVLHVSTKTVLFLILCIPTVVILLADVIRYYYTQDFSLLWLLKYSIICWVWYYAFQKIIPDSPGAAGPSSRMGNYPQNNNQRFLNQ